MTLPHEGICEDCYMKRKCKPSAKERAEMFGCGLKKVGDCILNYKTWPNGSMLFEYSRSELFLHPEQIKYCVNWLNLHNEDLKNNKFLPMATNEEVGITICSVNGITSFATDRYFAMYNSERLSQFKKYINKYRKKIGCQEVLE